MTTNQRVNPDLFEQAKLMMTEEQIQDYAEKGKEMYEHVDFSAADLGIGGGGNDDTFAESIAYITEALKSGLHPTYLDENEVTVMKNEYGKDWYTRFGYNESDVIKKKANIQ